MQSVYSIDYYNKYRKYKQKYLNLKQNGGDTFTDINTNLYLKFTTEKLIALLPTEIIDLEGGNGKRKNVVLEDEPLKAPEIKIKRNPTRLKTMPPYFRDFVLDLTPQITRYLTPESKARMVMDIEIDNEIIKKLNDMQEREDPDYVLYENFGKLIESWIADNMKCPCCYENTLRRYSSASMPIIDVVCINPLHTIENGVKFFQIKASNGSLFLGKPYFNYDPTYTDPGANTIHVGSRVWGEQVHSIRPTDTEFIKKILCGYICIGYRENPDTLTIVPHNSFIVLPDYLLSESSAKRKLDFDDEPVLPVVAKPSEDKSPDNKSFYYKYIPPNGSHQRIEFNLNTNKVITNDELMSLIPGQTIVKTYEIKTMIMPNPLSILE